MENIVIDLSDITQLLTNAHEGGGLEDSIGRTPDCIDDCQDYLSTMLGHRHPLVRALGQVSSIAHRFDRDEEEEDEETYTFDDEVLKAMMGR